MEKLFTASQAIKLLGEVMALDEDIMRFIEYCYMDEKYQDVKSMDDLIVCNKYRRVLSPNVNITLCTKPTLEALCDVIHKAQELEDPYDLRTADAFIARLAELKIKLEDD